MAQSDTAEVAANVRAEIARAGFTARGLSRALGTDADGKDLISSRTLSRRLTGDGAFRIDELTLIADALGIPLAALLPAREQVAS